MSLGACTELSHFHAVASVKPNSRNCKCTAGISYRFSNEISGYNGVLSLPRSKRNENRVVTVRAEGEGLSGSAVGVVKKEDLIDGKNITVGDIIIGLPSSGLHSNGFSLVRRVLAQSGLQFKDKLPGGDTTIAETLMTPTTIYVKQVLDIISKGGVKGIAHITGGGFTDNIPRVFPKGLGALIYENSWDIPTVFKWLQEAGKIEDSEMMRTFNMGIGMVLVVSPEAANGILENPVENGKAYRIGEVISGNGVTYC